MINSLVDLVFPRRCAICGKIVPYGSGLICRSHDKLPFVNAPSCMKCGKEVEEDEEYCRDCREHPKKFDRGYPLFNYVEPVKSAVLDIKYKNSREYLDYFSEELGEKLKNKVEVLNIDALVPVPVHKKKYHSRGYNQAELLAKKLGKKLQLPVINDMLVRVVDTKPQKELDHLERYNNLKQAFAIKKLYPKYNNIMLVDDIYTTGATSTVCGELLKAAGINKVYVAVICIGNNEI